MADSAYRKVNELNPTYAVGWYTRARINVALDTAAKKSMAKPFYEKFLELSEPTIEKAEQRTKTNMITAYAYLGEYYVNHIETPDLPKALTYFEKMLALDPANADIQTTIKNIKDAIAAGGKDRD